MLNKLFIAIEGERGEAMREVLEMVVPGCITQNREEAEIIVVWDGTEAWDKHLEFPGKLLIVYRQMEFTTGRKTLPPTARRIWGEAELKALCHQPLPIAA